MQVLLVVSPTGNFFEAKTSLLKVSVYTNVVVLHFTIIFLLHIDRHHSLPVFFCLIDQLFFKPCFAYLKLLHATVSFCFTRIPG